MFYSDKARELKDQYKNGQLSVDAYIAQLTEEVNKVLNNPANADNTEVLQDAFLFAVKEALVEVVLAELVKSDKNRLLKQLALIDDEDEVTSSLAVACMNVAALEVATRGEPGPETDDTLPPENAFDSDDEETFVFSREQLDFVATDERISQVKDLLLTAIEMLYKDGGLSRDNYLAQLAAAAQFVGYATRHKPAVKALIELGQAIDPTFGTPEFARSAPPTTELLANRYGLEIEGEKSVGELVSEVRAEPALKEQPSESSKCNIL